MASLGSYTSTSCQILPELTVLSIGLWHEILLGEEIPQLNKEAKTLAQHNLQVALRAPAQFLERQKEE